MKRESKRLLLGIFALGIMMAGCSKKESHVFSSLKDSATTAQLKQFVAEKIAQSDAATNEPAPAFAPFFAAAKTGDWLAISNAFEGLRRHAGQYQGSHDVDERLSGPRWETVKEVWGAFRAFGMGDEKYSAIFGNDIVNSIPPGSIYFGGTDPGRFIVTAMEKSQVNGDPFFALTQNALADSTYLDYLHSIYDGKIYIPTAEDSQKCFEEYSQDAGQRLQRNQLKPGEKVSRDASGHIQIGGEVAVMGINGLIAKIVFDKNPGREFYIEESFPLDWMYPYLEPHGLIFKIDRQPLVTFPDDVIQMDHDCWRKYASGMIGNWLHDDTPVNAIAEFAEKAFSKKDFATDGADPRFVKGTYTHRMFSKERNSIAGLYVWRAQHASDSGEKQRMSDAADFAFRQAFALCPYNPEVVHRYVDFLKAQQRIPDARLVAEAGAHAEAVWDPGNLDLRNFSRKLKESPQ